jgi:general L-amino acid transport system substrate-binding protein
VRRLLFALLATLVVNSATLVAVADTLDSVRSRGLLVCGISGGVPGFAEADDKGQWNGFEADFCHGLAAAILGRREAVRFQPLTGPERIPSLAKGEVDVLARATTWTLGRDGEPGVLFVAPFFYDGHKFLVRRSQALSSVLELSGASVCVEAGSAAEQAVNDFFSLRKMKFEAVALPRFDDALRKYLARGCVALAGEGSQLAAVRARAEAPAEHAILPENISREPLGPMVRRGDDRWFLIVRWVINALVAAEELGVTMSNADQQRTGGTSEARRLLGGEGQLGRLLGLDPQWALQMIKQVGNYGELFERHFGSRSPLRLERGLNSLWTRNGLIVSPPFR